MERKEAFERIARIVFDVYGIDKVALETTINSFNAVSEDNDEFIKRLRQEFRVDMSGFRYFDFFHEDQFGIWSAINRVIFALRGRKKAEVTIDHLVGVTINRKWEDPTN